MLRYTVISIQFSVEPPLDSSVPQPSSSGAVPSSDHLYPPSISVSYNPMYNWSIPLKKQHWYDNLAVIERKKLAANPGLESGTSPFQDEFSTE